MSIPSSNIGGAGHENKLPRLNSAGKIAGTMGGGNSEVATLDAGGKLPSGQAPAKAVYSTAGAQALIPSDIGAQASDATLTALAGLATGADKLPYSTGADVFAQADFTAAGRALLDDASAAAQRTTLGVGTGDSPTFAGLTVAGDLNVTGARVVIGGEKTAFADNFIDLNANYTAEAAQPCGIVASYDPSPGVAQQAIAAGGFVAGVAAVSNPTVEVAATTGFVAGQIVRMQGSTSNDGFYEVDGLLATPPRLRIKGIGTVPAVEGWTGNQFTAEAGLGTVTLVNVAILGAASGTGNWQVAKGSTVPLAYSDITAIAVGAQADISQVDIGDAQVAGASGKYADAAHQHALPSPAAPANVDKSVASAGASATVARADHKHDTSTAAPNAGSLGTTALEGASTSLARADHSHQANTAAANIGTANSIGVSSEPARADHVHNHPSIAGDLHPEYIRVGGLRDFTGSQKFTGQKLSVRDFTAASTAVLATDDVIRLSGAANAADAALPSATGSGARYMIATINVVNATRVVPQAGDAIDGAANGVAQSLVAAFEGYVYVDVAANKWLSF